MKKILTYALTAALTALSAAGCGKPPAPTPVIRVGHAPHDHHSPLYVAALNPDYFREHGGLYLREVTAGKEYEMVSGGALVARVTIDSSVGGKELVRKLAESQFDISFGGLPAMLVFIDEGAPLRIISPVMAEGAGLVVRKDLPAENWDEFLAYVKAKGEPFRVGYKADLSVQNLIFEEALKQVGLPYGFELDDPSVKFALVNVHGPKNLIPSMESGLIDGFVVMQPYLALAEEKGIGKTVALLSDLPPAGKWEGNPCCALAASNSFVAAHRPAAEVFLTLMMRANGYIAAHPAESARQVAEWLGVSTSVEEISLPTIRFTVDLGDTWERGVNFWIESMIATGVLKGAVRDSYQAGTQRELIYDIDLYREAKKSI